MLIISLWLFCCSDREMYKLQEVKTVGNWKGGSDRWQSGCSANHFTHIEYFIQFIILSNKLYFDMLFQDFHRSPNFVNRTAGWARIMLTTTKSAQPLCGDFPLLLMTSYCLWGTLIFVTQIQYLDNDWSDFYQEYDNWKKSNIKLIDYKRMQCLLQDCRKLGTA